MTGFLRGWRRKTGVMTLVLACVLTVGWLRSPYYTDCLERIQDRSRYAVCSTHSRLFFMRQDWPEGSATPWGATRSRVWSVAESRKVDQNGVEKPYDPADMGCQLNWRWTWFGFYGSSGITTSQGMKFEYRMIPWWSVVVPLTLFTGFLLLGKPRIAKGVIATGN